MKTILLIEDNEFIRENTAEILEMTGYAVVTSQNGKEGVAKALETKPDLVVCDIMMPVLDGYGVLQIFNQNPQLAGVPFIFLTAKTERTDLRRGMELGADDYLTKPFDSSELLSAIASRLARFQHLQPERGWPQGSAGEVRNDAQRMGALAALSAHRKPHAVSRKQIIYAEGDEATRLYYVQAGRVKTSKTTPTGKELITGLHAAGAFLGYNALLEGTEHHDSAVALEDSTLLYIPVEEFTLLLQRSPEVSQHFVRLLAGHVREQEERLLDLAYSSLRKRVAEALLRLHEQQHVLDPANLLIQLSRDDMAALVGTAPESLSRTLSEFRQSGLIELNNKFIRVLLPEQLQRGHW